MYGVALATSNTIKTMNNNDMGSKVNRAKCAGEHFKNDFKTGLKASLVTTAAGAGVMALAYKPQAGVQATKYVGKGLESLSKLVGKFTKGNFAKALKTAGEKIIHAAPKYGKAAAIATVVGAGLLALTKITTDHAYKAGTIDQKYIDNAKIENMTNSVVV